MGYSKNLLVVGLVSAFSLIATATVAQTDAPAKPENPSSQPTKNKSAGGGPNPYRDCGIGGALFSNPGWAAVTSNVIWDLGLTALTSATSSPQTCNGKQAQVAQFIADTYVSVVEETAQGAGEHLTAMLELYECPAASHGQIVAAFRGDVGASVAQPEFASLTAIEKAEQYYLIVNRHVESDFAQSCRV